MLTPEAIAHSVMSRIGDACGEVAYEAEREYSDGRGFMDDKAKAYFKKAKKAGCRDLSGAYADHLYNDVGLLGDWLGDWVHDECRGDRALMVKVWKYCTEHFHDAVREAARKLLKREKV